MRSRYRRINSVHIREQRLAEGADRGHIAQCPTVLRAVTLSETESCRPTTLASSPSHLCSTHMSFTLPGFDLTAFITNTLSEDLGIGLPGGGRDITSESVIPADARFAGVMDSREAITVAGLPLAAAFFSHLDPACAMEILVQDGQSVKPGTALMRIAGKARALLTAERNALNIVRHLSGIATMTRAYVEAMQGRATLLDTRKTIPGCGAGGAGPSMRPASTSTAPTARSRCGARPAIEDRHRYRLAVKMASPAGYRRLAAALNAMQASGSARASPSLCAGNRLARVRQGAARAPRRRVGCRSNLPR